MRTKFITITFMISTLVCGSLSGCQSSEKTSEPVIETATGEVETQQASEVSDLLSAETTEIPTVPITLTFVNLCDFEIGMIAVIDPVTQEQMNLVPLSKGESASIKTNWPISETKFQWALYNTAGELCLENTTDIGQATNGATVVLSGKTTVDDIQVLFE